MKAISTVALCALMAACAAYDSEPEPTDDEPALGVVESELAQCGIGCSAGYHPLSYDCLASCGSCTFGKNHTNCARDTGTAFQSCGFACPGGYHVTEYSSVQACNISGVSIAPNRSTCRVNSGTSFLMCGLNCPAPYHAVDFSFVPSCNIDTLNRHDNRSLCQR